MSAERRTVAVVGGGSAGFTAARVAAEHGARVLLFMGEDPDHASLCVNHGCMPSKAMFEPIDAMHRARAHGWLRVEPHRPAEYLAQIVAWKDREIARFRAYRQAAIRRRHSDDFQVIRHAARFVDPHTLEAAGERHRADAIILATGSRPRFPSIDGLAEIRDAIWCNEEILANTELPESLLILGGGAIAVEFSLRYARLGCRVSMAVRSRLLSDYPEAFGERLALVYEHEGIRVLRPFRAERVRRDSDGWFVVEGEGPEGREPLTGQRLLLATGRDPALDSLALEKAGVDLGASGAGGRLAVGEDLRVAGQDHVFAAGDAIGRRMVVHLAHIEAGIAAENAVTGGDRTWSRRANLEVVFSDPEFAFAGVSAQLAEAAGHAVLTGHKESRLVGKLHLAGDDLGFGELVADADDHRLLGAGLLCAGAADLIHLPAYVIERQDTVHDAAMAEYYHPTRMEIVTGILDDLCRRLGRVPPRRADE